ncbi:MAG TPA: hypothetical protein VNU49_04750 [Opitutaceae bacterium]|jgi:hypothetical protein|nr:hypothetical protein [Opitutaceae bacterium]
MSLLPADPPRMPKWPFLVGDALLLGLALAIGFYTHNPFAGKPLVLIVACVALGAVLGTWPFIADYESKRNEALDERQRGLEALAHTITSSAEQISIAAQSLPGMAEAVTKSLKSVEQLPARFQEKIFEAAAQKNLAAAGDKLDAKAAQIFKQLDAKIAVLTTLAEKFSASAAPLPEEKPVRTRARKEPETPPSEPIESVERASPEPFRQAQGLEPVEGLVESAERAVAEKPASIEPIVIETPAEEPKAPRTRTPARKGPETPPSESAAVTAARPEPAERAAEEKPAIVATARGEPASPEPASSERVESTVIEPPAEEPKTPRKRAPKKSKGEDAEPSLDFDASAKSADSSPAPSSSTDGDEFSQPSPDEVAGGEPARPELVERVESAPVTAVSADGATRLLVTAYIGIGNKLFLRGDGPGLSWDEGVPLQFVSIGKWRWETADATKPVHAKLYKNDELVCASLGKFTLDPGQQAEVTAAF